MRFSLIVPAAALLALAMPTALADHPTPEQMDLVQRLAHQLEQDATRVHRLAEQYAQGGDPAEAEALRDLHEFETAARHFHRQTERFAQDPAHTEEDWIELNQAFERARTTFAQLDVHGDLDAEFSAVEQGIARLRSYYQGGGGAWQGDRAVKIAHEIENAARAAHRQGEREAHHATYWERAALARLHQLEEAADHFHAQVEASPQDPRHTRGDLGTLETAFRRVDQVLPSAHFSSRVLDGYNRARELFQELRNMYRSQARTEPAYQPRTAPPEEKRRFRWRFRFED